MMPKLKSLRLRLSLWILVVALATLGVTCTLTYFQRAQEIKGEALLKLSAIRDLKVRTLERWIDERSGDLRIIGRAFEVRSLGPGGASRHEERFIEDEKKADAVRELFLRYVRHYNAYSELMFVSAHDGRIAISTDPQSVGVDRSANPYFTVPLKTGEFFIKDIYSSRTVKRPSMTFSMPVACLEHDGAHVTGVVVARVDLEDSLYKLLLDRTGMGATGETLIVNRKGLALNQLRHYEDAPLQLTINARPARLASDGETGIIEAEDYRGVRVLAAFEHIPVTGWGFVAKQDLAELHAPIEVMYRQLLVSVLIAVLFVVVIVYFLARTISSPLQAMAEAASRIQSGDLTARVRIETSDEIGRLGRTLNDMAKNLGSHAEVREGAAELVEIIAVSASVTELTEGVLNKLMSVTGSQVGVIFRPTPDRRAFEPVVSVGAGAELLRPFDAEGREGQLGRALSTREISHLRDIPPDTVFTFRTVAGDAVPKELMTIPVLVAENVEAIIALASITGYTREHRQILDQTWSILYTALANLLASEKVEATSEELIESNLELRNRSQELELQADELQQLAVELRAQRRQVEETSRLKSQFLSNMSHELRTPLNSVLALSQLMISRGVGKDPEQEVEYLEIIERNGRQLLALINDVLDLSKIEAGRVELSRGEFEIRDVVGKALETTRPLAEDKDLELTLSMAADLPAMHSDAEKLRRILLNLLSNAVKFTDDGEVSLAVTADVKKDRVVFSVTDTGIGISPAELPHIFDEFRQVDGSSSRRHGGTGLGLSIAQHLAGLLGGRIVAESRVGEGSTFSLSLPIMCPEEAEAPPRSTGHEEHVRPPLVLPEAEEYAGKLILVVEDDEVASLQVRSVLEDGGFRVEVARGGAEGVDLMFAMTPDAVVLDLMMPDVDGFQVLREIRANPRITKVPVVILTSSELSSEDLATLKFNNIQQVVQKGTLNRDQLLGCVVGLFAPQQTREVSPHPRPGKVLVVEDNPDNLATITAILDEAEYAYLTAENGEEALRVARASRPALILMDMQLPVMSGLEATRRIKAEHELVGTPIVAVTASAMKGDEERFIAAGCDDYLEKPIDAKALMAVVRDWVVLDDRDEPGG